MLPVDPTETPVWPNEAACHAHCRAGGRHFVNYGDWDNPDNGDNQNRSDDDSDASSPELPGRWTLTDLRLTAADVNFLASTLMQPEVR